MVNLYFSTQSKLELISQDEYEVLSKCIGDLDLNSIADLSNLPLINVQDIISNWNLRCPQMFINEKGKENSDFEKLKKLKMAYLSATELTQSPDIVFYHTDVISDANNQFEEVETTLSHMYREPHKGLRNLKYGEAFLEKVLSSNDKKQDLRILEVGCGVGNLAKSFLSKMKSDHPNLYQSLKYTMLDLSKGLQESQKEVCREHIEKIEFISGNVETFDFPKHQKFDFVIANEMIADLSVMAASTENLKINRPTNQAEQKVIDYKLDYVNAPPLFLVNTGAILFIEKLRQWLDTNGTAYITEFGPAEDFPIRVRLGGHDEYSINFSHLISVAKNHQLNAKLEKVANFLNFDKEWMVLSGNSYLILSEHILPFLGLKRLDRAPYDETSLKSYLGDLEVKNLYYGPLKKGRDLLSSELFYSLTLSLRA
jgi:2-polyprenyl-3-methyl-5-hydroxy-6-metoxy-1,4-benzoquinol methylase